MKRELVAVLILALLLGSALLSIRNSDRKIAGMIEDVEAAEELCRAGNPQKAAERLDNSLQLWLKWERFTEIALRQEPSDEVIDSYYILLAEIQSGDDVPPASYGLLKGRLTAISDMEKITLGNIF